MISLAITEQDILTGVPKSRVACPIAKAAMRHFTSENPYTGEKTAPKLVEVDHSRMIVYHDHGRSVFCLPWAINGFINTFDAGLPVEPCKLQIEYERTW